MLTVYDARNTAWLDMCDRGQNVDDDRYRYLSYTIISLCRSEYELNLLDARISIEIRFDGIAQVLLTETWGDQRSEAELCHTQGVSHSKVKASQA